MKKNLKIVAIILIGSIWIGFIFYNSSNAGNKSHERSLGIVNNVKKVYYKVSKIQVLVTIKDTIRNKLSSNGDDWNYAIRKSAHFFEFLVLAVISYIVLNSFNLMQREKILYTLFICLFMAVLDEFNQSFTPNRTSSVRDVLIDFTGSTVGITISYIFFSIKRNIFRNTNKKTIEVPPKL